MGIQLSDLFILSLLLLAGMYWWHALGIKQIALDASKSYCKKMDVQMLDESVELRGFWFKRDPHNRYRLWRSYFFEFSSMGDQRYKGRVVLLGQQVLSIELEPYRIS